MGRATHKGCDRYILHHMDDTGLTNTPGDQPEVIKESPIDPVLPENPTPQPTIPGPSKNDKKTEKKGPGKKLFEKGNPGGPGRPKNSVSITEGIRRMLETNMPGKEKKTYLDAILKTIMQKALEEGDTTTIKTIWNYVDGLPKGSVDIGVDKENLETLTDYFKNLANGGTGQNSTGDSKKAV